MDIKEAILRYRKGKSGWVFGGRIERDVADSYGCKPSTVARTCRELAKNGRLQRGLMKVGGVGKAVVRYRAI